MGAEGPLGQSSRISATKGAWLRLTPSLLLVELKSVPISIPSHCPFHADLGQGAGRLEVRQLMAPGSAHAPPGAWLCEGSLQPNPELHGKPCAAVPPRSLPRWAEAHSLPAVTIGGRGATLRPGPREVGGG